jgi:RND family efflux transporter MFP subunit
MRALLVIVAVVAVLGGGGYGVYRYVEVLREEGRPAVRTVTAQIRDLQQQVSATGEVRPVIESIVKSEVSGRIAELLIEEGDSVERGQPVLLLDTVSLKTRLREVERSLEADRLRYERAKRNLSRISGLFERNFAGEQDFLDAQTDYELAALSIKIAETRVEDALEDLARSRILAPHSGVVTRLNVTEGQVIAGATSVSNGTDLMTIADLANLYMEASINEVDVGRVTVGDLVDIAFDAHPDLRVSGVIQTIAPAARREGNTRVFPIQINLKQTDARIRPGISATVSVTVARAQQVVAVSLGAVFTDETGPFVFVETDRGFERRKVELGISDLRHVELISGIGAGDNVAQRRPPEERMAR